MCSPWVFRAQLHILLGNEKDVVGEMVFMSCKQCFVSIIKSDTHGLAAKFSPQVILSALCVEHWGIIEGEEMSKIGSDELVSSLSSVLHDNEK